MVRTKVTLLSEKQLVEQMKFLPSAGALRSGYQYVNLNTVVAGQVIESVVGKSWGDFLNERLFQPLGMKRTFASAQAISKQEQKNVAVGHFTCGNATVGPFDLIRSPKTNLGGKFPLPALASGSIFSTINDMTKFLRLLLNKGEVDIIQVFQIRETHFPNGDWNCCEELAFCIYS